MVAWWFFSWFVCSFVFFKISCENVTNLHNFLGVRVCVISLWFWFFLWRGVGGGGAFCAGGFGFGLAMPDFDD